VKPTAATVAPRTILWGIATLLVMVPLLDLRDFGNPTTAPRYALLGLGVAVLVLLAVVTHGLRAGFPKALASRPVALTAVYVGISLVSTLWGVDRSGAIVRGFELCTFFGLFLLATWASASHPIATTAWLVRCASVVGAAVGALAVAQSFGYLTAVFEQVAGGPAATFGNKNVLATYLDGLLVPSLLRAAWGSQRTRALRALPFVLVLAGLTVTRSRGAWLAAGLTCFAFCALLAVRPAWRRTSKGLVRRVGPSLVAGAFLAVLLALSPGAASPAGTPLASAMQSEVMTSSLSVRRAFDTSSLGMLRDHPFGVGLGSWRAVYPAYARLAPTPDFSLNVQPWEAHCDPLEILCETGLFGGFAFVVAVASALGPALSTHRGTSAAQRLTGIFLAFGLVTILLHSAVDFPLRRPASAMIFFVWLGLLGGLAQRNTANRTERSEAVVSPSILASRMARIAALVAVAVGAVMLVVFHVRAIASDLQVARARRSSDTRALYSGLARANAIFPYSFQVRRELARTAHLGCSQNVIGCDVARAQIRRVLEDEPHQPRFLTDDGTLRMYGGDLAGARRSYVEAVALLPEEPACLEGLASLEAREGHEDKASELRAKAATSRKRH
jgi:O-antigen ligase